MAWKPFTLATFVALTCALFALYLPLVNAECCSVQTFCPYNKYYYDLYCFNCEKAREFDGRMNCGVGSCNLFGCNCDGGCIKYNSSAWCTHEDKKNRTCKISWRYRKWFKNLAKWGSEKSRKSNKIKSESFRSVPFESSYHFVKDLVSVVRKDFSEDPILKDEFKNMALKVLKFNHTKNVDKEFDKMDTNHNGVIELTEIDSDYGR